MKVLAILLNPKNYESTENHEYCRLDRQCRGNTDHHLIHPPSIEGMAIKTYQRHILVYVHTLHAGCRLMDDIRYPAGCMAHHPGQWNHFGLCWYGANHEVKIRINPP